MRDKDFYISAVKMDLLRVVNAIVYFQKTPAVESAREFLKHALSDMERLELNDTEKERKNDLIHLEKNLNPSLHDPRTRLRWADDVLTVRCRL